MPLIAPVTEPASALPRRPWRRTIALTWLAAAAAGLTATGCNDGSSALGSGPVRDAAPAPDGRVYVVRAFAGRSPAVAVLLDVDPATGAAAPILPRTPAERLKTITDIAVVAVRPGRPADAPELVIAGPELGLSTLPGPFVFRGPLPVATPVSETGHWPPAAGAPAAVSPGGGHLLLFRPRERSSARGERWDLAIIELGGDGPPLTLEPSITTADRQALWLDAATVRLGDGRSVRLGRPAEATGGPSPLTVDEPDAAPSADHLEALAADDRTATTASGTWSLPPGSVPGSRLRWDPPAAATVTPRELTAPFAVRSIRPLPGTDSVLLVGADGLLRGERDAAGIPRLVPITLVLDRGR